MKALPTYLFVFLRPLCGFFLRQEGACSLVRHFVLFFFAWCTGKTDGPCNARSSRSSSLNPGARCVCLYSSLVCLHHSAVHGFNMAPNLRVAKKQALVFSGCRVDFVQTSGRILYLQYAFERRACTVGVSMTPPPWEVLLHRG